MHDVQRQYRSLFVSLLGVAIVTHFVVIRVVIPSLDPKSPIGFLMQTMIYTSIVVLPLFVFEKWAWKWFNRQIDLTGPWQYSISYVPATNEKSLHDFVESLPREGITEVVQSPFSVRFASGAEPYTDEDGAERVVSWYSTSADFLTDTRLVDSFELRAGNRLFRGVEETTIQRVRGRPVKTHTQFFMYDTQYRPIASGELFYQRPSRKPAWSVSIQLADRAAAVLKPADPPAPARCS